MSVKEIKTAESSLPVGPYSQAVEVKGMVFISGIIPIDSAKQELVKGDISLCVATVFSNLDSVLRSAGIARKNIVKATIYMKNIKMFDTVNRLYGEYFKDLKVFPARSTVEVSQLPKGADIEMDFIAVR